MMRGNFQGFDDFSIRPVSGLDDVLGCEDAKAAAMGVLRHTHKPPKMFLTGPSGSGKSTIINEACRYAACEEPSGDRACHQCKGCLEFQEWGRHRTTGIFAEETGRRLPFNYLPINCRNFTSAQIHDEIEAIRSRDHTLRVIHLEEAGSLYRDRCDESLTDLMDDPHFWTCKWFATAVEDTNLDEQFRRRWNVKVTTTRPPDDLVALRLAEFCVQEGVEVDDPETLIHLAERSHGILGLAGAMLPMAKIKRPHQLTRDMVFRYPFPDEDPWKKTFFKR